MITVRTLKPAKGRLVRHPGEDKRPLDPAGEEIQMTSYWTRKLLADDVVDVSAKAEEPAPKGGDK